MSERKVKRVIGITGSMGSGKSMVKTILSQKIPVIDCDQVNADLQKKDHAGYLALRDAGLLITDENGDLDRQGMADLLFEHPEERRKMESILHPLIIQGVKDWISRQDEICAVEVPLLFECGMENLFDEIWTVTCSDEIALDRLEKQRHISPSEAKRRLALQYPVEKKIAGSDHVLYNNGTPQELEKQITALLEDKREE